MNLKHLLDQELLTQSRLAVAKEREATTSVLFHLREIEKRLLFAAAGASSLFEYAVKHLGYSEPAASRRLNAMRLIQEIPQVATAIETGALSLSNAASVQVFLKRELREQGKQYSLEEKKDIIQSMERKSKREGEKLLLALSPASAIPSEKLRPVSDTQAELKVVLNENTVQKLEKIRCLLAHQNPGGSYAEMIELMADLVLDRIDPERKEERAKKRRTQKQTQEANSAGGVSSQPDSTQPELKPQSSMPSKPSESSNPRFVSASVRRQIYLRDRGQCTYVHPQSGVRCSSKYGTQVDHSRPVALGGKIKSPDDGRLLCRFHNLLLAQELLGPSCLRKHVPSLR